MLLDHLDCEKTVLYRKQKQEPHQPVRSVEITKRRIILLSSFVFEDTMLPEYYYFKDGEYRLFEDSKELEELVNKYIATNIGEF